MNSGLIEKLKSSSWLIEKIEIELLTIQKESKFG